MAYGVKLEVAYDGGDFVGWQAQDGQRTVQAALGQAATAIADHPVEVRGASRTDAGVHALGQVAAFDTRRLLTPRRWLLALNRYLPPDVAVTRASPCDPNYEPRFDARHKAYRYLIYLHPIRDPLLRGRAWHLGRLNRYRFPDRDVVADGEQLLDLDAMDQAAAAMVGTHDYRAFRAALDTRKSTERNMARVELVRDFGGVPELLALEVVGTSFMKHMVRIMVGTLVEVGRGRLSVDDVRAILTSDGRRDHAGETAPAHGLTLVSVTLGRLHEQASHSAP